MGGELQQTVAQVVHPASPGEVSTRNRFEFEKITLALILFTYLLIAGTVWCFSVAPWLMSAMLCVLLAFHTSLVHEIIHGHPTSSRTLNDLLGAPPLTLLFPYRLFRESHLAHHQDEFLTLPGVDPESFFHDAESWRRMNVLERGFAWINMTLAGRLLFNPARSLFHIIVRCGYDLWRGNAPARWLWIRHISGCAVLLWFINSINTIPVETYLICVYLSHSLISLRSFFEHRPEQVIDHRIVVVEGCPITRLLFLNNNFHATHHRYPGLPWYEVAARFRAEGGQVIQRNGGFYFSGYKEWLRFLFRPIASPIHPFASSDR